MLWVTLMPLMQYLHDLLKSYKYNHTKMNMIHLHFQPSSPPNKRQFCLLGHSSLVSLCCALHLKKTKNNPESLAALLFHRDAEERPRPTLKTTRPASSVYADPHVAASLFLFHVTDLLRQLSTGGS